VRLRSSRGFGSSGLARLARAQERREGDGGLEAAVRGLRRARTDDDKTRHLQALLEFAAERESALLMLGMGVVQFSMHAVRDVSTLKRNTRSTRLLHESSRQLRLKDFIARENSAEKRAQQQKRELEKLAPGGVRPEELSPRKPAAEEEDTEGDESDTDSRTDVRSGTDTNSESEEGEAKINDEASLVWNEVRLLVLRLLSKLAEYEESSNELLESFVIDEVMAALEDQSSSAAEARGVSQMVLANMASQQSSRTELLNRGIVEMSIKLASRDENEETRIGGIVTLLNLANNTACASRIVEKGGIDVILSAAQDFHGDAEYSALGVLKNLVDNLDLSFLDDLLTRGIFEILLEIYTQRPRNPESCLACLYIFRMYASDLKYEAQVWESGVFKHCLLIIGGSEFTPKEKVFALRVVEALCAPKRAPLEKYVKTALIEKCRALCAGLRNVNENFEAVEARGLGFKVLAHLARDERTAVRMTKASTKVLKTCLNAINTDNRTEIKSDPVLVLQAISDHEPARFLLLKHEALVEKLVAVVKLDSHVVLLGTLSSLMTLRNLALSEITHVELKELECSEACKRVLGSTKGQEAKNVAREIRILLASNPLLAFLTCGTFGLQ